MDKSQKRYKTLILTQEEMKDLYIPIKDKSKLLNKMCKQTKDPLIASLVTPTKQTN